MEAIESVYINEATELINGLENSLLVLENDSRDKSAIEGVFRVMHTLKGSSNMFGYDHIGHLTHDLENIYDKVRKNQVALSKEIYDVTYRSIDHIRQLIEDRELADPGNRNVHDTLLMNIKTIEENKTVVSTAGNHNPAPEENAGKTFYVFFKPDRDIIKKGNNPLYIIDELVSHGQARVFLHAEELPSPAEMEISDCYLHWEVLLYTEKQIHILKDVFMFVEDESELDIKEIAARNLLENGNLMDELSAGYSEGKRIDTGKLQEATKRAENKQPETEGERSTARVTSLKEKNISSIRVSSNKLDDMMNLISELITTQARLNLITEKSSIPELANLAEEMDKVSRQLRDNAFSMCLIPIQSIYLRFQRLIRDLSAELSKNVNFVTEGGDTELDKNIIEKIVDPIMHLLRNSMDHGIESAEDRKKAGKDDKGTILLKTYYSGSNVHIRIRDDGAGINLEKIRAKAVDMGIIKKTDRLSDKDLLSLIFHSGLSTAKNVSNVSGRGVGMDVVRKQIDEIRGEIDIVSEEGKGTTITIKLPLTLSIIDGLLLDIDKNLYVIPLENVQKIYALPHNNLERKFQRTVILDGEQYPFVYLREEFNIPGQPLKKEQVVLIKYENQYVGIVVDRVEGEHQAVLKPIGKLYRNQEYISGASILGDGSVVLVLDPYKIVKEFAK